MHTFNDTTGQTWAIAFDIGLMRHIKRTLGVDLLAAIEKPDSLVELADDIEKLVNVVWLCVADQAAALSTGAITDEEFGRRLDGQSVESATRAMLEALADFFPPRKRAILHKIVEKATAAEDAMLGAVEALLETDEIEKIFATRGS